MSSNSSAMTINDWLAANTQLLQNNGIDSARLDCILLLCDALGQHKAWILAHLDEVLDNSLKLTLDHKVAQRSTNLPLAYIRGAVEFYGHTFTVNSSVLIPRPESESMLDLLSLLHPDAVIDVGTGSGCLAISAKLLFPSCTVLAIDIDAECLRVAQSNADMHGVGIMCLQTDLLETTTVTTAQTAILANLPYVPYDYPINEPAKFEPRLALFADSNGLALYELLFEQLAQKPIQPKYVITESLLFQHLDLSLIAAQYGYRLTQTNGLAQLFEHSVAA